MRTGGVVNFLKVDETANTFRERKCALLDPAYDKMCTSLNEFIDCDSAM